MSKPHIIIVTGPTASGKTSFAQDLALACNASIINADVVQMYTPLSIGTAKPDWRSNPVPQYLFDCVSDPIDTSVVAYRRMVIEKVDELTKLGKPIIIVGGSLFYITSLFYPPHPMIPSQDASTGVALDTNLTPWEQLHQIDTQRASELHPNDIYRIQRALAIWQKTGCKPSLSKPVYKPPFQATIIWINPDRTLLTERINKRTIEMMHSGWIEEAELIMGTPWEEFITKKGFIGYPEIFSWISRGKNETELPALITTIQLQTRTYAKRQAMFCRRLVNMLEKEAQPLSIIELPSHECTIEIKHRVFSVK